MKTRIKNLVNSGLAPLGVELVRRQSVFTRLDLKLADYEISERPDTPLYLNVGAGQFRHPSAGNTEMYR